MSRSDQIESMQERIVMMQTLMELPGWKLFEEGQLAYLEVQSLNAACESKGSLEAGKHLGVLKTVRDLRAWPEREIQAAQMNLAELLKEQ